jgi:acetyl esterase/lipase
MSEPEVPGPAGAPAPTPTLYYTHGGGMVAGDQRSSLPKVMALAEPLGAAVVSVEYRLAPERGNQYPDEPLRQYGERHVVRAPPARLDS